MIDELEVDIEGAIGLSSPAITGGKSNPVLRGGRGDQSVVDGAARDAERGQLGVKLGCALRAEKERVREVMSEQPGDLARSASVRRRQPGQHREGLKGRVAAKSAATVADGPSGGSMVFVTGDRESNRDAGVDQELGPVTAGRHRAASGPRHR